MSTPLCLNFQRIATWVWQEVGESYLLSSPLSEESLTEFILKRLRKENANAIKVVSFKKHEEALNGADWEFWFKANDPVYGTGWRVQAKRIYNPEQRYSALTFGASGHGPQIQKLISAAHADGMAPMYCFYNWIDNEQTISNHWNCGTYTPGASLYGCSIANAHRVQLVQSNKFSDLVSHTRPWHCAVCCPVYAGPDQDPAIRAAGIANSLSLPDVQADEPIGPRELPDYVRKLQDARFSDGAYSAELLEASGGKDRGIAGIVLIDPKA